MGIWAGSINDRGTGGPDNFSYSEIHETLTIPEFQQMIVMDSCILEADLILEGDLILEI